MPGQWRNAEAWGQRVWQRPWGEEHDLAQSSARRKSARRDLLHYDALSAAIAGPGPQRRPESHCMTTPEISAPFPYDGPQELLQPIVTALRRVVDPEVAMNVVEVGLIYGVSVAQGKLHAKVTMTSAACPVTDLLIEEMEAELDRDMPPDLLIQVELVWEPPWTTDCMSESARRFMGW